jgi:cytidine deaminase
MDPRELMDLLIPEAREASKNAYIPYSGFWVGAALLGRSGKIYRGCNIENSAFGPSNCAERTAFFTAVAQGEREFTAIAIVGGFADGRPAAGDGFAYPCGVCRQVMAEFCRPEEFLILLENHRGERRAHTLAELLPYGFSLED